MPLSGRALPKTSWPNSAYSCNGASPFLNCTLDLVLSACLIAALSWAGVYNSSADLIIASPKVCTCW